VADVSQGAGWWMASDGKWYSPEQAPAPPPPGYPQFVIQAAPPKTSGMAVASFVLSLVWLSGLGSLLAVVFALVARKNIKESQGRQTGDGLAIAGLIIGILGLLGTVLLIVTVVAVNHDVNHLNH
jgi:uncharacterized protein DUF4190